MGNECGCTCVTKAPNVTISNESTEDSSPNSTEAKQNKSQVLRGLPRDRMKNNITIRKLKESMDINYNNSNPEVLRVQKLIATSGLKYVEKTELIQDPESFYTGYIDFKGQRQGHGLKTYGNGDTYQGDWIDDQANGQGRFQQTNGDMYEGTWQQGMAHGFGTYQTCDGQIYCGYWENDLQNGNGKEEWPDGSYYEGTFRDGMKHGEGKYQYSDCSSYEGQIKENLYHGQGKFIWSDQKEYRGEWKENKLEGTGQLSYPDGRKYTGQFKDDMEHGDGHLIWPDPENPGNFLQYQGQFQFGEQHGVGVFIDGEGIQSKTEWSEGEYKGICEIQY